MMTRKRSIHLLMILVSLLPQVYLCAIWNDIPAIVPIHYNMNNEPDGYGTKNYLWLLSGIISVIGILVYLLLQNLHRIDPKRVAQPNAKVFDKLSVGVVIFMTAINLVITMAAAGTGKTTLMVTAIHPLIGLMIAVIGNYMYNVKPNYFVGIRLPWTLSSDYNWRKTHQLASRVWFIGGILLTIVSLLIPSKINEYVMLATIGIITAIPIAYSFTLFKKEQAGALNKGSEQ